MSKPRKPALAVGQDWILEGAGVRVCGWGQEGGGGGNVRFLILTEGSALGRRGDICTMEGRAFRREADPILAATASDLNARGVLIAACTLRVLSAARKFAKLMAEFDGEVSCCDVAMTKLLDETDRLMALEREGEG